MALSMLVDDQLSMNRINPYTLTGTFGVPTDGMYKTPLDARYTTEIDPIPAEQSEAAFPDAEQHFAPSRINMAGGMMANTVGDRGNAPSALYPARKYQYDDGHVTFVRPSMPRSRGVVSDNSTLIMLLVALAAVLFVFRKNLKA
jgi:hypothetical protein